MIEPAAQLEPGGHEVHCDAADRPVALEYVPVGHGTGTDVPSGQYDPATHGSHAVLPVSFWKVPAAHLLHSAAPAGIPLCEVHVHPVDPQGQLVGMHVLEPKKENQMPQMLVSEVM